jgi:hypothetical protein
MIYLIKKPVVIYVMIQKLEEMYRLECEIDPGAWCKNFKIKDGDNDNCNE